MLPVCFPPWWLVVFCFAFFLVLAVCLVLVLLFVFVMIFLTWNCQGVAAKETQRTFKEVIRTHKPQLVGLLEPKISGFNADKVCNSLGFDDWVRVEALGFSGGVWVIWQHSVHVEIIKTHPQFIFSQVQEHNNDPWGLAIVYGSPSLHLRRRLWRDLNMENVKFNGPWLATGDFNAVASLTEVSNPSSFCQQRSTDFTDWIFQPRSC